MSVDESSEAWSDSSEEREKKPGYLHCSTGESKANQDLSEDDENENENDISAVCLFPKDLQDTRREMMTLKKENASLRKSLEKSEEKSELLKMEIDTMCKFRNPATGPQLATCKIVELSKKIRQLSAELGASKLKSRQLQNEVTKLTATQEEAATSAAKGGTKEQNCGDLAGCSVEEYQQLKKELGSAHAKLLRSRSEKDKLKCQLDLAHKVIESEVGRDVEDVIREMKDGDWRGRAERVEEMKVKVAELTSKLESRQSSFLTNRNKVELLKAREKEMKAEHCREVQDLKLQLEEYKRSNIGAKARYHVLECELRDERNRIKLLMEKSHTDEEIIDLLKKKTKSNMDEKLREEDLKKEVELRLAELQAALERTNTQCVHLMEALEQRDGKIHWQDEKIAMLRSQLEGGAQENFVDNESFEAACNASGIEDKVYDIVNANEWKQDQASDGVELHGN